MAEIAPMQIPQDNSKGTFLIKVKLWIIFLFASFKGLRTDAKQIVKFINALRLDTKLLKSSISHYDDLSDEEVIKKIAVASNYPFAELKFCITKFIAACGKMYITNEDPFASIFIGYITLSSPVNTQQTDLNLHQQNAHWLKAASLMLLECAADRNIVLKEFEADLIIQTAYTKLRQK